MSGQTHAQWFWDRMFELYGMKWPNSYGEDPTEMWVSLMGSLDKYQIKWAVKCLVDTGDGFVPTMPQVAALARSTRKPVNTNRAAIGAEKREYTPEQLDANRKKLKRVYEAAQVGGELHGLQEHEINAIIKGW